MTFVEKRKGLSATTADIGLSQPLIMALGAALVYILLPTDDAANAFSTAAFGMGIILGFITYLESRRGVRQLIRVDMLMLWVLYGLTFFEFLFPQRDTGVSPENAINGISAVLIGFVAITFGRALVRERASQPAN